MRLFGKKQDEEQRFEVLSRVDDPVQADRLLLDQFHELGWDLTKPRDARFYLYVRTEEDARAAVDSVRAEGYAAGIEPSATPGTEHPWLVLASRDMVVDADSIAKARGLFDGLAERYSGDYDGWEAAAD